jgi:CheY-like chemotaxis protein
MMGSSCRSEFCIPDDLWPAEIDENQFTQVMNNLVINAVQAMCDTGTIRVSAENMMVDDQESELEPGPFVAVTIEDEGPGIPHEYLDRIFDPYFTTKQNGTGLGLAISYSIVNQHGGIIKVDSSVGEGSRFRVLVPALPDGVPRAEADAEEPVRGAGRILVMDDDEGVLTIARQMLSHLGYSVEVATDGDEAVALYRAAMESTKPGGGFDVVVLDLTVPGGRNGVEAVRELKLLDPDVRAIVSSGYFNDPVMANYADYGFSGVLTKPYRLGEIGSILREVCADSGEEASEGR